MEGSREEHVNTLKVFACGFEPVTAAGLRSVLSAWPEFYFAGSAASIAETLNAAREQGPDVILLDASGGRTDLHEFLWRLNQTCPQSRAVLWVADGAGGECARAISAGAKGVIRRTSEIENLRECLRSVGQGRVWLEDNLAGQEYPSGRKSPPRFTPRETEILGGVLRGWKNREIADALHITPGTVKVHLLHIYEKAGVRDRFELSARGRKLLELPPLE